MPDLTVKDKKGRSIKITYDGAVPDAGAIDRAFKQAYPEQPGRVGKPGMSFTPISPSSLPSYQQPDMTPDEMGQIRNQDVNAPSFSSPTRRKSDAQRVASTLFGPGVGDAVGNVDKYVEGLGTTAARQVIPTLGAVGAGAVGTAVGGPLVGIPLALAAGYGLNQVQDDLSKRYTPWLSKDTESITRRFAQSHPIEAIGAGFLPGFLTGHPSLSGSAGAWARRAVGAASMAGIDLATQQAQHPGVVDWGRLGITALAGGAQSGGLTPLGAMIHGEPIGPGARPVASEPWQRFTPDGQAVDIQGQIPGTGRAGSPSPRFDVQSEAGRFRPTLDQLLSMSSAQAPEPNVGDVPGAMFARRTAAPETPVQPPIIANRRTRVVPSRGTIYLGNEDANLLRQTTGQDWTGAFLPAERVQQELTKLDALLAEGVAKGQNTDAIEHLRDLVKYGSDGGVKDLSLVDSARPVAEVTPDRREETGHKAIRGLVTDPVVQSAVTHPAWQAVTKALTDIGYDGTGAKGAKLHTEEALVKMAAGKANELGLTHDQARDLFGTLFEAGHGAHGDAFTLALQTGNKEFRGIANDTASRINDGRTGFSGQEPGTTLSGVSEGGQGGIGSNVRPAVSGLGRERFTAAANERINRLVTGINAFAGDGDRSRDAFASLPANLQRGLTRWATSRNLAQGAKAGDIHPDQLQNELVSRNLAPPGKSQDGRAFASWVRNDHAPEGHPDGFLWAESPYEAARIAHLNNDPFVSHVERAERFQVTGKDGKAFYYTPDFKITYGDGRVVYEEIKPSTLTSTERVQAKANAAKVYTDKLSKDTGRPVEYRTVTEASMGPDVFKSAKDSDAIAPNLPEDQRKILNGRLQTAVGQARRQQASIGDSDARFARKPLFSPRGPQSGESIRLQPKKGAELVTYTIKSVDPVKKTVDVETTDHDGKVLSRYANVPFDTWAQQQQKQTLGNKLNSAVGGLRLLNPVNRVMDVLANSVKASDYLLRSPITAGVDSITSRILSSSGTEVQKVGGAFDGDRISRVMGRTKEETIREAKSVLSGQDTTNGKFAPAKGIFGVGPKMAGLTDVPFKSFYTELAKDFGADMKARETAPKGASPDDIAILRDQILTKIEDHPDIELPAQEFALRETLNSENAVSEMQSLLRRYWEKKGAGGDFVNFLGDELLGRYSKVITNVATDVIDRTGVGVLRSGYYTAKALQDLRSGAIKEIPLDERLKINELASKGLGGLAMMAFGYFADDSLKKAGIGKVKKGMNGGNIDYGDLSKLGGAFAPFLLGAMTHRAQEIGNPQQRESMVAKSFMSLPLNVPLASNARTIMEASQNAQKAKTFAVRKFFQATGLSSLKDIAKMVDQGSVFDTGNAIERQRVPMGTPKSTGSIFKIIQGEAMYNNPIPFTPWRGNLPRKN